MRFPRITALFLYLALLVLRALGQLPNGNINGFLSVTDNNVGNGDEGADTLTSVETLGFANVVLNAALPVQLFNGAVLIGMPRTAIEP